MKKEEFRLIVQGALHDAIVKATLYLRRDLPKENIRLIGNGEEFASGWDESVEFLLSSMYFGEEEIKPCGDLIVDSFNASTTTIRVFISGHAPGPYSLNWQGGTGPFIKAINSDLLKDYSNKDFTDTWIGK